MKTLLPILALAAAVSVASTADAARVTFAEFTDGLSAGNVGYTMTIDPDGDSYDTVDITITPLGNGSLTGSDSPSADTAIGSGDGTAFSAMLAAAGAIPFGATSTASHLKGTFASMGSNAISNGPLDFADVVLTPGTRGFTYAVHFADDGTMLGTVSGTVASAVIPLPAGLPLLIGGIALLAPLARRRS